jgi:hypothetical protein
VPRRDTIRFSRGDRVYALAYLSLNRWALTYHGRRLDSYPFWPQPLLASPEEPARDSSFAVARSEPRSEDWWYVRTRRGVAGYWHGDPYRELHSVSDMVRLHDSCPADRDGAR